MNLRKTLDAIEQGLTDVAAKIGPFLAPIPTAYAVGHSVVVNLGWPGWLGYVAAAVIELLGLATVGTALRLRDYNASKRKSDPKAPFALAVSLAGVYLVTAITLAVLLDVVPALARWTPAVFPLLSLAGVTTLAIRNDHRKRVDGIAQDKARRRKRRKARRQRKRKDAQEVAQEAPEVAPDLTPTDRRAQLLALWRQGKAQVFAHAAPKFGVSRQTISNDFSALEAEGKVKRNGQGVEVLG